MTYGQHLAKNPAGSDLNSSRLQTTFFEHAEKPVEKPRLGAEREHRSRKERHLKRQRDEDWWKSKRGKQGDIFWVWKPVYNRKLEVTVRGESRL